MNVEHRTSNVQVSEDSDIELKTDINFRHFSGLYGLGSGKQGIRSLSSGTWEQE